MDTIFSHSTALDRYRLESTLMDCASICAEELRVADFKRLGQSFLNASRPTVSDIRGSTLARRSSTARELHVLIPGGNAKRRGAGITFHLCAGMLPPGSIVQIGPGEFISSPELCFAQMAQRLSLPTTIQLGYELCGTYAIADDLPQGMARRDPLTSPALLGEFLSRQKLRCGTERARMALQYILPASASPMETVLAMLLFLPKRHGGYGLPAPTLNGGVKIERRGGGRFICDMLWPRQKVAVEYDSDMAHTGREKINRDSRRRAALERCGIRVITVTKDQVKYADELDEVAHVIAKALKCRIRTSCDGWSSKQAELRRAILPRQWQ